MFSCFFLVTTLTEKQARLLEVESIKEDASTNYVSFNVYIQCSVRKSLKLNIDSKGGRFSVLVSHKCHWLSFCQSVNFPIHTGKVLVKQNLVNICNPTGWTSGKFSMQGVNKDFEWVNSYYFHHIINFLFIYRFMYM